MNRESLGLEVVNYDGARLLSTVAACTVSAWQWIADDDNVWGKVFVKMFLEFAADSIACERVL